MFYLTIPQFIGFALVVGGIIAWVYRLGTLGDAEEISMSLYDRIMYGALVIGTLIIIVTVYL